MSGCQNSKLREAQEAYYALVEGIDVAPLIDEATRGDIIDALLKTMDELRGDVDSNESGSENAVP